MQNFITDYTLSVTEGEERYIVMSSKKYYSVNKFTYDLLSALKEKYCVPEIVERLDKLFPDMFVTAEMIIKILSSEKIKQILYPGKTDKIAQDSNYIWFKLKIISPENLASVLAVLSILFKEKIYSWLFLILSITTVIVFLKLVFFENGISYLNIETLSTFNITIAFLASLCITFIHEIGHAAAAFKNNVTSKSIGFGLYFVMPVFFTELTDIWRLPKSSRIQVNLGGIYFQLLINILLIIGVYATNKYPLLAVLFFINTISVLASLNPFFRYDGYWILSDLINVFNLREKSTTTAWSLLKFPYLRTLKSTLQKNSERWLIAYSLVNIMFWLWVYFELGNYLFFSIKQLANTNNIGVLFIYKIISLLLIAIYLLNILLKKQTWIHNIIRKK